MSPFLVAARSLFNHPFGVPGIFSDADTNLYTGRCVIIFQTNDAYPSWETTLSENKTTVRLLKEGFDSDLFEQLVSVEVNGKNYKIDGVVKEDDFTITYSVIKVD